MYRISIIIFLIFTIAIADITVIFTRKLQVGISILFLMLFLLTLFAVIDKSLVYWITLPSSVMKGLDTYITENRIITLNKHNDKLLEKLIILYNRYKQIDQLSNKLEKRNYTNGAEKFIHDILVLYYPEKFYSLKKTRKTNKT